jgi:glutamate synthase domain-containing protein 3
MTGGNAYVLDETGEFASASANQATVDLERVEDPEDIDTLQKLIFRHLQATGSPRAGWVLEHWEQLLPKFWKVFPHELKRVLGIPRRENKAGAVVAQPSLSPASALGTRQALHG